MYIDLTDAQKALRDELRDYFAKLITPELRPQLRGMESGDLYKQVVRQMGSDGWLGVGWPEAYGGRGFGAVEQFIWFDEARRAGAPIPFVTLNTVGPALMAHGTDAQKEKFLRGILAGEFHFAIGYSEPDAGTDLAALKTAAVREGDEYVVNGTKIFTSGAESADYVWLACRTDPDAKKHKGISMLIVDTRDPGFSFSPIHTVGDGRTNMSYYQDVRVPVEMRVGEENAGWKLITLQLNHERVGLAAFSGYGGKLLDDTVEWACKTSAADGHPVADQPWVQACLGEAYARFEAMKVMNWRMAWQMEQGDPSPVLSSASKVFSTETLIEVYRLLLEVLGMPGLVKADSPGAQLRGDLEREWRMCQINTYGGGVNEIQREIVAMMGLGLPRAPR
ncbi:MAG: acyl-CoA dehydrogenase family protein [Myxococcales bacterium]|nr:acyl-CoA dehydrogenase family protein [Myxococcales bacterium]